MNDEQRWAVIFDATKDHNLSDVQVVMADPDSWVYMHCDCGEEFKERWMYADHLRRLIQKALDEAIG